MTDIGLSYIIEIRVKELERIKRPIEIFKEELMRVGIFTDTYFPQVSGVATSVRVLKEEFPFKALLKLIKFLKNTN